MTITLYSCVYCPWAARTWLALKEAKIDFKLVEIDLSRPREQWYLDEINPVGKVPALSLEDGSVLCESSVCSEYVADVSGRFLPADALGRAQIKFFIETFTSKFPAAILSALGSPVEKQREILRGIVASVNAMLQKYLQGGPFLLGSQEYTLAEIDCVPFLARFRMMGEAGLLSQAAYDEIKSDAEFALFNQYLDDCLARKSHIEIWDQQRNLQVAQKRVAAIREGGASTNAAPPDYIFLQDLAVIGSAGLSSFSFEKRKFPLTISMSVRTKSVEAGVDDYAISYGDVAREVSAVLEENKFDSLESAAAAVLQTKSSVYGWQSLSIAKDGGLLRAEKEVFKTTNAGTASYTVSQLRIGCIIGVYDHERISKQDVVIDLSLIKPDWKPELIEPRLVAESDTRRALQDLCKLIEESSFKTVEALAEKICEVGLATLPGSYKQIQTWISKPSALVFAKHSGVCVTRSRRASIV